MKTEQIYRIFRDESTGISIDSRSVAKGQIFFALWGQNYNGNKFAEEALEKGASYAVIDDPVYETEKTILVDDCLLELQTLAAYHRKEMNTSVLAITGTNGKTTTKELIAAILAKKYKIHYTKGNLNNHIGVPLTILSAPADAEMMIRGAFSSIALSTARVIISPTTEPMDPPIKLYSMAEIMVLRPPRFPRAFTKASLIPVEARAETSFFP